jgi:hypothetical protein
MRRYFLGFVQWRDLFHHDVGASFSSPSPTSSVVLLMA